MQLIARLFIFNYNLSDLIMIVATTFVLSLLASANALCDHGCSGHGTCDCTGTGQKCVCYDNWGMGMAHDSGDCSDRICPFELAWVDTPQQNGLRHRYSECAGRGTCNRETGECECFDGYEGKGCQRTVCPNDCSGHGTCEYLDDLTFGAVEFDYRHKEFLQESLGYTYYGWDRRKTRGCVCDPEYADVDCSKRMCPYGNDVMDHRDDLTRDTRYQTQRISFYRDDGVSNLDDSTYALTFKSKLNETFTTIPLVFKSTNLLGMANEIESALHQLPNGVIDGVHVHCGLTTNELVVNVTFTGDSNQGRQHLLTVEDYSCGAGCTPRLTGIAVSPLTSNVTMINDADHNSFECGRRGKCDYETGICQCFEGFTGPSCGSCTSLI